MKFLQILFRVLCVPVCYGTNFTGHSQVRFLVICIFLRIASIWRGFIKILIKNFQEGQTWFLKCYRFKSNSTLFQSLYSHIPINQFSFFTWLWLLTTRPSRIFFQKVLFAIMLLLIYLSKIININLCYAYSYSRYCLLI